MHKTKILMVCLGNICRSPLAEGILQHKVDPSKVQVDSAGTGGWHVGDTPDKRSIAVARKYGIDITQQQGRQFTASDFSTFDRIFVMDSSNLENVLKHAEKDEDKNKVSMILDVLFPGEKVDVPDPYYGSDDGFERVFQMLDQATDSIVQDLENI